MDYDKLSIGELQEVIARAEHAIGEKRTQEVEALRTEVVELIKSKGFSFDDILPTGAKLKTKNKIAPAYRDPNNSENTWTGRGRKPKWVLALIESGMTLDELRI